MKAPAFLARWRLGRKATRTLPELETLVAKADMCIVDLDNHIRGAELTVRRLQSLKKQKGVAKESATTENGDPSQLALPGTDSSPEPSPSASSPRYYNAKHQRKIELYRKAGFA